MAGKVVVSTLNNDTGVLATQNGMTGIAKAWVNFNGTGTVAIRDSFNVSSITDNGTGDYTVNFTTAMPNANYSCIGTCNINITGNTSRLVSAPISQAPTTTSIRIATTASSSTTNEDMLFVYVSVFSS
jgi:hypothetical protein